ncbi:MAG: ornithine cyclodeaminase family protein [Armatimonadota bacterium]|nr:ornithine cyclodeaminase family protein [Armatimonadota bacterium]MDR7486136.1 ornithine cyclodeaminase family protein [Armatimonadota bacterium]MDR7531767.1 ornithine cyclodeaminase family protein [Armatimonadota bacterium]MDR7534888.1 ornithine cyclodeaminase family protein [Armatimonadota bacterium]
MPVDVLYLSAAETRQVLDAAQAMHLVEQALRWQADGQIVWSDPAVLNLQTRDPDSHYRLKGCYLRTVEAVGFRVTGFHVHPTGAGSGAPDNTRFVILSDPRTGRPQAIIDEHWTYNVRTVAAAAVAARYLARRDSAVLGLVGSGQLATTGLVLLDSLFHFREVRVTSRRPESREGFAHRMRGQIGGELRPVDSPRDAVVGADLVVTCTSANTRLVEADWLERGVFVCALGRGELADAVYETADKIVMDSWQASQEAADVRGLVARGVLSRERLHAELGEIVAGLRPGREAPEERIVARIEGLASQDVAIAHWVVAEARCRHLGTIIPAGF